MKTYLFVYFKPMDEILNNNEFYREELIGNIKLF